MSRNNCCDDIMDSACRDNNSFVVAFLPEDELAAVRQFLCEVHVLRSRSWDELHRIVASLNPTCAVLDPLHMSRGDTGRAILFLRKFPLTPTLAYVALGADNFHAVAKLAAEGLQDAFLHPLPDSGRRLKRVYEQYRSQQLVNEFLGVLAPTAGRLPANVFRAVTDLFERPQRYRTATDLAAQSGVTPRHLHRTFEAVRLGTPRKLMIAAKVLRAYAYLREPHSSVAEVTHRLGYDAVRVFRKHTDQIFGCSPAALRLEDDRAEVMRHLLEWFHKPVIRRLCLDVGPVDSRLDAGAVAPRRRQVSTPLLQ
jgi:AraC-like DNA-binding protein